MSIIELEADNYHLLIKSEFADGSEGNWVVDTGASKSVFDKRLAQHFVVSEHESEELHSAGESDEPLSTQLAYMKPFSFAKFETSSMKVALLDLSHINNLYAKVSSVEVCGLLGSDFLLKHGARIDYKRKRIVWHK